MILTNYFSDTLIVSVMCALITVRATTADVYPEPGRWPLPRAPPHTLGKEVL